MCFTPPLHRHSDTQDQDTLIYLLNVPKDLPYCRWAFLTKSTILITARKRSLGQGNIFTPVCHSVHRGGVPDQVPPIPGTPPQTRYTPQTRNTPRDQVHPPGPGTPPPLGPGTPPSWTRYTPLDQVHPPRTRYTPPRTRYTPQGPGTPLWPGTPPLGPGTPPQVNSNFF